MKKSYLRGTRLKIFFAIILVFVSLIATRASYNSYTKSAETLYNEGDQFTGNYSGITYIKLEALEKLDIVDEKLADDEKFYMVQHEHGFVILKATQEDIKKLIQSSDVPESKIINLKDKNLYSRIDVIEEKGRKGRTNINEALITGESKPVHKEVGNEVIAGSINCNGYIEYEAVRIGRETNISNIVKMVVEATNSKTEIQKFVDKVSGIFVPAIFILAVLASILNFVIIKDISIAVNVFVTVLVVACPCALGIATPLAMVVSIGKLSRNGIFIKSSESLEILNGIKNIVFDKTGTLTNGKFSVVDKNISDENMQILQSIEFNSKHPIAQSICEFSDFNKIEVTNFREIEGYGLQADIGNITYYVGSSKFVKEQCINNIYGNDEEKFLSNGYTIVYLFNNDGVLGIVGLADTVKDGVKELIQELKNMNKNIYMLTGDNEAAAKIIAKSGGFTTQILDRKMIGQVALYDILDFENAISMILENKNEIGEDDE